MPLEEFVGLHGPLRVIVENVCTALISNALSIGSLTLMPFTIGRVVLWLKHNGLHLLLHEHAGTTGLEEYNNVNMPSAAGRARASAGRGAGGGGRAGGVMYSDGFTLVVGYATLVLLALGLLLLSASGGQ